jgi:hypothetical protein
MPFGGLFTDVFLKKLQKMVIRPQDVSWEVLLRQTREMAQEISKRIQKYKQQTACYVVEVNTPENTPTQTPPPPTPPQENNLEQQLVKDLMTLANPDYTVESKIPYIQQVVDKYFTSPKARVEFFSKNGKVLLDRKTAEDFVKRLVATQRLLGLAVMQLDTNERGKITYLKLHEIYQK